jgi:hypothetical protein
VNLPLKVKKKSKIFRIYGMKAYRGSRGIAPLIVTLGTGRTFYFPETTPVPIE